MYDRRCNSVWQREVEESMGLCIRFMMSCEDVERKRCVEGCLHLRGLGGA